MYFVGFNRWIVGFNAYSVGFNACGVVGILFSDYWIDKESSRTECNCNIVILLD